MTKIFRSTLSLMLENSGLSQIEFAKATGLTQSAVSQFLSGRRTPSLDSLIKICETFNITPNDILGFDHNKESIDLIKLRNAINKANEILSSVNK